jgi:hypothetical protein
MITIIPETEDNYQRRLNFRQVRTRLNYIKNNYDPADVVSMLSAIVELRDTFREHYSPFIEETGELPTTEDYISDSLAFGNLMELPYNTTYVHMVDLNLKFIKHIKSRNEWLVDQGK